jgi:hypothetical protein
MGIFIKGKTLGPPIKKPVPPSMRYFLTFSFLLSLITAFSQGNNDKKAADNPQYVQFSGVVLDQDSLTPIPYVSVAVKGTQRATVCDIYGFFSLVVKPGDQLEFLSITHKTRTYKLADTLKQKFYYAIQVLTKDTVELPVVDIYPWPSKDDFKRAFLALDLSETDAERADKNLSREELSYLERTHGANAAENYKYLMQAYYTKVYTSGQSPVNNLLSPIKWAEFIQAWRAGKFNTKKK